MSADEVRALYLNLLAAWNRQDAKAFADLFADDAAMIGFDGSQARGPEIHAHIAPIFADHPTARYVTVIREVRPLGETAAVLRASVGMMPRGSSELNPAVNALQTVVAARQEGRWQVVLLQNTPAQYHGRPDLAEQHTAELADLTPVGE